jgi:DNA-binding XRE family transcriptional regulator
VAKIETAIRDAIARGARRQVRQTTSPLRREVRRLRAAVGRLRQEVTALKVIAERWRDAARATPWHAGVSDADVEAARLSAGLVRKLRSRLGLSQAALGRLVGVSGAAVVSWEQGRSSPAGENRRALIALRRRGRRDVRRLLDELPAPAPSAARGRRGRGKKRSRRAPAPAARRRPAPPAGARAAGRRRGREAAARPARRPARPAPVSAAA